VALLVLAIGPISGCGKTAKVSGTVTYKGAPLPSGVVAIHGANDKTATAQIVDGNYAVVGAPVGEVKITVFVDDPAKGPSAGDTRMGGVKDAPAGMPGTGTKKIIVPIPDKYAHKDKTPISTTLKSGQNDFPIVLDDK
jgi:hypothetical protein